jgi:hypothetical protein
MDMMTLLYGAAVLVGLGALLLLGRAARSARRKHSAALPASQASTTSYQPSGLNWMIASAHRSVAQLIGLEMSTATLPAVILSVLCAVAGLILLSWSAMHNLAVSAVAGLATLVLGILIENISINALKNIRQASEAIRASEEDFYQRQGEHLDQQMQQAVQQFSQQSHWQSLSREQAADLDRARKEQRRVMASLERQKRTLLKQQTRAARRIRRHAVPFAIIGVGFSATAGGLFWHQVLSALDLPLNLSISTMFALAVSVTFIQSELFKHAQGEAIKEAMRTNEMQTELFKQQAEDIVMETTIEALEGVRNDPAAMSDVQQTVKKEIKATIKHLTARATSRLVRVEEVPQRTPRRLSAPRTGHVQTADRRGDGGTWTEQDTTGQRVVDSLDRPFTVRTGQDSGHWTPPLPGGRVSGQDSGQRTPDRTTEAGQWTCPPNGQDSEWTGQGRTVDSGQGNDQADKAGQDNVSRIQAYLSGHPRTRQTEIAAALGISTKTVQRALAKLKGTSGTDRQENLRIVR